MTPRFIGAIPDDRWRAVLAHCLEQADGFRIRMPEGAGPLGNGREAFEQLPSAQIRAWDGMRDAIEILGPLSEEAAALFSAHETSLELIDPQRKLWDYQLLRGDSVLLSVSDFTDLIVDEADGDVLARLGIGGPASVPRSSRP